MVSGGRKYAVLCRQNEQTCFRASIQHIMGVLILHFHADHHAAAAHKLDAWHFKQPLFEILTFFLHFF